MKRVAYGDAQSGTIKQLGVATVRYGGVEFWI